MSLLKRLLSLSVVLLIMTSTAVAEYPANITVKMLKQTDGGQEWTLINRTMNESVSFNFNGLTTTYYSISPDHQTITFDIFKKEEFLKSVALTQSSSACLQGTCTGQAQDVPSDSVMLTLNSIHSTSSTGTVTRSLSKTLMAPSNYSIVTLNYSGADFTLAEIKENIPDVFDVTVISPNTTFIKNGTEYNFTPLQTLEYKLTPNQSKQGEFNKRFTITGTFRDADLNNGIIEQTGNITVIADDKYNLMRYDINHDNLINKNEALLSAVDYFKTKTISLTTVIAIVTKYFAGTHIL